MSKRLFFIHGRGFKPYRPALEKLWFEAIEHVDWRETTPTSSKPTGTCRESSCITATFRTSF